MKKNAVKLPSKWKTSVSPIVIYSKVKTFQPCWYQCSLGITACKMVRLLLGGWKTDISSNTKPQSNSEVLGNTWESPGNGACWKEKYTERRKRQIKSAFAISEPPVEIPHLWISIHAEKPVFISSVYLSSQVLISPARLFPSFISPLCQKPPNHFLKR